MSAKDFPLVSVVSINYNTPGVTAEMIESFRKVTYPNIELIIVDNASTQGNVDELKAKYPEIKLFKSNVNLGFAGGNNLGIRQANGKYILLLNNDTEVEPGFLEPLVDTLERNPQIGAVSPKIYFHHTENMLQYAGFTPINRYTVRSKGIGHSEFDRGQYDNDYETAYAHGAAMMVPIRIIREVGLMADIYFLYYEELDWAQRIKDAGYKIHYVHSSVVYHKESVSTGKSSPLKTYYINRSRILFIRRNFSGLSYLISILFLLFISVPKNIITFTLKGDFKLLSAYLKGVGWHVNHLSAREVQYTPVL
ncbi:MAG: glycosyltransferase family 2 protein [Sedimentisphaerales bacterium]|nr:glycosyltransferase family 2 protein [Sedimentisphaerales bacterium]